MYQFLTSIFSQAKSYLTRRNIFFNNSSSYAFVTNPGADLGNGVGLFTHSDITISFWINSGTTNDRSLFTRNTTAEPHFILGTSTTTVGALRFGPSAAERKTCTPVVLDSTWHFVCLSYDNTKKEIESVVDGALFGTYATSATFSPTPANVANWFMAVNLSTATTPNTALTHQARYSEFRVYNVVLTTAEKIANMYGRIVRGMVVEWLFMELSASTTAANTAPGAVEGAPVLQCRPTPTGPPRSFLTVTR